MATGSSTSDTTPSRCLRVSSMVREYISRPRPSPDSSAVFRKWPAISFARESVISFPVRFLYSTQAGCGRATQTGRPSTRNLMSTASAWRGGVATIRALEREGNCFFVPRCVAGGDGYDQGLVEAVYLFLGPAVGGGEVSEHKKIKTRISVKTGTFANISPSGVGGQTVAGHRPRALDLHVLDEKRPPASGRRPANSAHDLITLRRALP